MAIDSFGELRKHIDSQDPFMTWGHQILKIRRPRKKAPVWAHSQDDIRLFLIRVFPQLETDSKQRERAGIWARVAYLYFNQQWSRGQIAQELNKTYNSINSIIRSIKRAAEGLRADTGKKAGKRKGRPRS